MEYWRRSNQLVIALVGLLFAAAIGHAAQPTKVRMSFKPE